MFAEAHRQIEFRNEAVRETVALQEKLRLAEEVAHQAKVLSSLLGPIKCYAPALYAEAAGTAQLRLEEALSAFRAGEKGE
jgi:hypothetical protein